MNNDKQHPEELLPWYINGSLSAAEQQSVDSHVQSCEHCQSEIAFLKVIREQVQSTEALAGPGDLTKLRFMNDIKKAKKDKKRTVAANWWQMGLSVAAVLVISVQAIMILKVGPDQSSTTPTTAKIDPASKMQLAGYGKDNQLKLRFQPQASITEINTVLNAVNASITEGPDADNFYIISIKINNKKSSEKIVSGIISQLEQKTKLIEYVDKP